MSLNDRIYLYANYSNRILSARRFAEQAGNRLVVAHCDKMLQPKNIEKYAGFFAQAVAPIEEGPEPTVRTEPDPSTYVAVDPSAVQKNTGTGAGEGRFDPEAEWHNNLKKMPDRYTSPEFQNWWTTLTLKYIDPLFDEVWEEIYDHPDVLGSWLQNDVTQAYWAQQEGIAKPYRYESAAANIKDAKLNPQGAKNLALLRDAVEIDSKRAIWKEVEGGKSGVYMPDSGKLDELMKYFETGEDQGKWTDQYHTYETPEGFQEMLKRKHVFRDEKRIQDFIGRYQIVLKGLMRKVVAQKTVSYAGLAKDWARRLEKNRAPYRPLDQTNPSWMAQVPSDELQGSIFPGQGKKNQYDFNPGQGRGTPAMQTTDPGLELFSRTFDLDANEMRERGVNNSITINNQDRQERYPTPPDTIMAKELGQRVAEKLDHLISRNKGSAYRALIGMLEWTTNTIAVGGGFSSGKEGIYARISVKQLQKHGIPFSPDQIKTINIYNPRTGKAEPVQYVAVPMTMGDDQGLSKNFQNLAIQDLGTEKAEIGELLRRYEGSNTARAAICGSLAESLKDNLRRVLTKYIQITAQEVEQQLNTMGSDPNFGSQHPVLDVEWPFDPNIGRGVQRDNVDSIMKKSQLRAMALVKYIVDNSAYPLTMQLAGEILDHNLNNGGANPGTPSANPTTPPSPAPAPASTLPAP
jgi:hypothetical protein